MCPKVKQDDMDNKKFTLWHRLSAGAVLVIAAVTYLLTIEPTASFWDCGEFIASSYKLEVGHPPGNPVFQLIARFFTLFAGPEKAHVAMMVNAMSALCSSLTIFFLYLTIVWFARRLFAKKDDGSLSTGTAIAVIGSGIIGSLAYCFSDTFWFSAVEGEVYAMSSLFTAAVFWAMTMWYDRADEPHSSKWIVLIAFLMGLRIGVHLLNLLAIPALVFIFYYRKREDKPFKFVELLKIFLVGVVLLGLINFVLVPYLPKLAAYVDLFFVNVLGLPYNSGAATFTVLLIAACLVGVYFSMEKGKAWLNTALLSLSSILIGFSIFSVDVIRSCAKTPTNEYQPDNAFTLVRYLSREQYGSTPLIYGQYFGAPYDLKTTTYWAPLDGKYKKVQGPAQPVYEPAGKMLFPRMWSDSSPSHVEFYKSYTNGKGKKVAGASERKPTMGANLAFFFDYQMNWMYWRYFMWNFVGRQNDIHSGVPGDLFHGNWESGIGFIDRWRLGDQSNAPEALRENKGKNHYFFLPLLLGLLGLFFQFNKDKRGTWLNFLMFFMTGIAIVLYLNQPPYQVRERDYAYAGSFYFFSVWIGLGVAALSSWLRDAFKKDSAIIPAAISIAALCVPTIMAAENWDDHDRSNRYTAPELAANYLSSVGENGMLVTHGDNDTFPLWYAQEVEGVRTDVRIINTSLLGTDWHIDQMKWACNESAPLDLSIPHKMYLYGNNEFVPVVDDKDEVMDIKDVIAIFKHPDIKVSLSSGRKVNFIASRKIRIPVDADNAIRSGIVAEKYRDSIPESIVLNISKDKAYINKPELFMLDLLSNYKWDRPINLLSMGGDINIGIKEYMEFQGFSWRLVPFKNKTTLSKSDFVDTDRLYSILADSTSYKAVSREDYFVDYQNMYTFLGVISLRSMMLNASDAFIREKQFDRAVEVLDKAMEATRAYPLEAIPIGFAANDVTLCNIIGNYILLGQREKGLELAASLGEKLAETVAFYLEFYSYASSELETAVQIVYYLGETLSNYGEKDAARKVLEPVNQLLESVTSNPS